MNAPARNILACVCVAYVLGGCTGTSVQVFDHRVIDGRKDPRSARPLVCATPKPCRSMNPNGAFGWCELTALVHSSLFRIKAEGGVRGDLATSWAFEDNGALNLSLHPDARWHDGRPVTTADIRATVEQLRPAQGLTQVEIINGKQCRIIHTLSQAEAIDRLAELAILPAHLPMDGTHAVGAGPFRYVETAGAASILGAHEGWHGGKVNLRSVILHVIPESKARAQALAEGQVDAAIIGPTELPILADARAFTKHQVVPSVDSSRDATSTLVVSAYVQRLTESVVSSEWAWVRLLAYVDYEGR